MNTHLTLNNGVTMPALGFGVFQTPPAETADAVGTAFDTGYRLIDTAASYGNERGVGDAIRVSARPRDQVFIESKVWISDYGYDETRHAFTKSARKLQVDVIDLFLLHQPLSTDFEKTIAAYTALEELLADGKVRAIGVSNFMIDDLETLLARTRVVPAVNQIEVHPYFTQNDLRAFHAAHGIITQAWSPLGGITAYRGDAATSTFVDPTLTEIARQHSVTPAQVMLRWHVQQGRGAIPKSVDSARIRENFDIGGFTLTPHDLARIDALDTGIRRGPEPAAVTLEAFHRDIPEE